MKMLEFKGVYIKRMWNEDHWTYIVLALQGLHTFGLSSIKETNEEATRDFIADISYDVEKKSYIIDSKQACEFPTIMDICASGCAIADVLRSEGLYQAVKVSDTPGEFIFTKM